ncbi:AAA family ATPase [Candidatus Pacearchaeota archaeon]|nr:AAA family ATPase [Candidatus Pacearchaeota archaeon]
MDKKINIAIAGGNCTGKTTLAHLLFSKLKEKELDYDYIEDYGRRVVHRLGYFKTSIECFYLFHMQQDLEESSRAFNGYVTETPLFHFNFHAELCAKDDRDRLGVEDLWRLWNARMDNYPIIAIAKDPEETPFRHDSSRKSSEKFERKRHMMINNYLELFCSDKLVRVSGNPGNRADQILELYDRLK